MNLYQLMIIIYVRSAEKALLALTAHHGATLSILHYLNHEFKHVRPFYLLYLTLTLVKQSIIILIGLYNPN